MSWKKNHSSVERGELSRGGLRRALKLELLECRKVMDAEMPAVLSVDASSPTDERAAIADGALALDSEVRFSLMSASGSSDSESLIRMTSVRDDGVEADDFVKVEVAVKSDDIESNPEIVYFTLGGTHEETPKSDDAGTPVEEELVEVELATDTKSTIESLIGIRSFVSMRPLLRSAALEVDQTMSITSLTDDAAERFTIAQDGAEWDFEMVDGQAVPMLASINLFHNQNLPGDANGDGATTALDVLLVVNELNARGSHVLPHRTAGDSGGWLIDVSGDQRLSPVDVLMIVDLLNSGLAVSIPGQDLTEGATSDQRLAAPIVGDDSGESTEHSELSQLEDASLPQGIMAEEGMSARRAMPIRYDTPEDTLDEPPVEKKPSEDAVAVDEAIDSLTTELV